jgi:hypothetical protein
VVVLPKRRNNAVEVMAAPASTTNQKLVPAHLSFTGFVAKFVNLSPEPVNLFWDGRGGGGGNSGSSNSHTTTKKETSKNKKQQYDDDKHSRRLVGQIAPFESLSTATTPGQSFSITPLHDSSRAMARWVVTMDESVLYYEPSSSSSSSTYYY